MITKIHGYQSSDGTVHGSLTGAQDAELRMLLTEHDKAVGNQTWTIAEISAVIIGEQERVIDILTMKASSKPRARKINGGTKTRAKKSTRHEAEQFPLPMDEKDITKPAA